MRTPCYLRAPSQHAQPRRIYGLTEKEREREETVGIREGGPVAANVDVVWLEGMSCKCNPHSDSAPSTTRQSMSNSQSKGCPKRCPD